MLLSVLVALMTMAGLPNLASASSQRLNPVQSVPKPSALQEGLDDIFNSDNDRRNTEIKGNRKVIQEEIDQYAEDPDTRIIKEYLESLWNNTSPSKTKLSDDSDEDFMDVPDVPEIHEPKRYRAGPHPRVSTLPDEEKWDPWYQTIELGYAWIAGFRPYMYWANTTNCFNRMSNFTYHELPEFNQNIKRPRFSTYEKIENTTYLIRNMSVHLWYCNSALTTASRYWDHRLAEYNGDVTLFFLSLLQNLLARVISMTNLYKSIDANAATGNKTGVHYDSARLVRILVIFEPVEPGVDKELDRVLVPTEE